MIPFKLLVLRDDMNWKVNFRPGHMKLKSLVEILLALKSHQKPSNAIKKPRGWWWKAHSERREFDLSFLLKALLVISLSKT